MDWWIQMGEEDLEGEYEPIALIGIPHETFASRFEISFTENVAHDAPGPTAYTIIEVRSGTQFLLQHEHDHPQPGVWLLGRTGVEPDKQRAEFIHVLGLEPNDYHWIKRGAGWVDAHTGEPV